MAFPPPYSPSTNFTDLAASLDIPRDRLDVEFMALAQFCAAIIRNLQDIQRSDGALANSVVTLDALSPSVKAAISGGWTPRGAWAGPNVKYEEGDYVEVNDVGYVAVVDHVSSGDFSTDRLAGNWQSGFALSILQTQPEINTYAATSGQTDFVLNSEIGPSDAILVYVNDKITADFTTSGNSVVLDTPSSIADEVIIAHFRVVDQSLVNTIFQARDEAEASATSASDDAALAAASETAAAANAALTAADAVSTAADKVLAETAATNAGASEIAAANSAQVSSSESVNASLAEDNVVRRILPGRYPTFAAAAASPYAEEGTFFVYSPDGGIYYINVLDPLDVRVFPGLTAQQTANIAAIAGMKARLNLFDGSQSSAGAANAYAVASVSGQEVGAYYDGMRVAFQAVAANTGAATLAVDGLAATPIVKFANVPVKAGDIVSSAVHEVVYHGGVFQLLTPTSNGNMRALQSLDMVADRMLYATGPNSFGLSTLTPYARSLLDDANAASMRSTLGLGLLATLSTLTSAQFDDIMPEAKGGSGFSTFQAAIDNANIPGPVYSAQQSVAAGVSQLGVTLSASANGITVVFAEYRDNNSEHLEIRKDAAGSAIQATTNIGGAGGRTVGSLLWVDTAPGTGFKSYWATIQGGTTVDYLRLVAINFGVSP